MLHLNIPVRTVNYIFYNLFCRPILISTSNFTLSPRMVWKGLPQDSILSPLLYNIYIQDRSKTYVDSWPRWYEDADYYAKGAIAVELYHYILYCHDLIRLCKNEMINDWSDE